ncbi:MAG: hydrogenase 3 maturation endopeptidase HyCI [Candidatus Omnitrophota bacterium]
MLEHLKGHLEGKVVIMGMGNTLHNDDGAGCLLASRIKDKVPYIVYDAGANPENYLGKIIKDKPDNVVIIDAVDFGGRPGEFREMEGEALETVNLFSTHNASLSLTINYLKNNLKLNIMILIIQPEDIGFGEKLSPAVREALDTLEQWFSRLAEDAKP